MAVPGTGRMRKNTMAAPSLKNLLAQKYIPGSNVRVPSIPYIVARIKTGIPYRTKFRRTTFSAPIRNLGSFVRRKTFYSFYVLT